MSLTLPPGPPPSTKSSIQASLWSLQIQATSQQRGQLSASSLSFPALSPSPLPLSSFLSSPFLPSLFSPPVYSSLPPLFLLTPSPPLPLSLSTLLSSLLLLLCSLLPLPLLLYPSLSLNPLFPHLLLPPPPSPQFLRSHLLPFAPYPLFAWSSHQVPQTHRAGQG